MNQRIDEVQKEFIKLWEELRESSMGRSSFVLEIKDKQIPQNFWLPTLEASDGSFDPTEHVAASRAQMALYMMLDVDEPSIPDDLTRTSLDVVHRLKSSSIFCFDQLAKEFKLNFLTSAWPKLTTASLLGMSQKDDKLLSQFITRFALEVQGMLDAHQLLVI
ncbi:hypothetical protein BHM03_00006642 [Ensete ventricosum]|nr:hypothetical protein BHM03_00006642 [Ensete ventricosum]